MRFNQPICRHLTRDTWIPSDVSKALWGTHGNAENWTRVLWFQVNANQSVSFCRILQCKKSTENNLYILEILIVMKSLLSAPQKDGYLVSKIVNKGPLYWEWQYFTCSYGQFEVRLVQSVLVKVGFHERKRLKLLWITSGKRLDVFWNLSMKPDVGSDTGSSRLWILPEACREPIRSAQVVAHLAKCENYFFSGNLVSKALGGEKKSSSSGVARCIFPLWTCSKFCTWMNTVLLGFTLVFPCLPPCTYPTHPFLLNLIQGCSFSVACECDEVTFSEL